MSCFTFITNKPQSVYSCLKKLFSDYHLHKMFDWFKKKKRVSN